MTHENFKLNKLLFLKIFIKELPGVFQKNILLGLKYFIYSLLEECFFQIGDYLSSRKILGKKINSLILEKKITIIDEQDSLKILDISKLPLKKKSLHGFSLRGFDLSQDSKVISLLQIYKYYLYYGDLRNAWWIRSLAKNELDAAIKRSQKNISSLAIIFSYLDLDITTLKAFIRDDEVSQSFEDNFPEIFCFIKNLCFKKKFPILSKDNSFSQYISNKQIGVVGPGNTVLHQGNEIDSLDAIIRLNFNEKTSLNFNSHGSKTNLSYYNHGAIKNRLRDVRGSIPLLDWACFKNNEDLAKSLTSELMSSGRVSSLADSLFINTSAMGLQNIVYDLIKNNAANIRLFCFDFYCSDSPYQKDYPSKETRQHFNDNFLKHASQSLRFHDPFLNFSFIKVAQEANRVSLSTSVKEVVHLSRADYASKMQDIYGQYNLSSS